MTLHFTILGCGSSGGVPRIGNHWGDCDPSNPKNRRRRCSLLIRRVNRQGDQTAALIDTSPDVRAGQHARAIAIAWRGTLVASLLVGAIGAVLAIFPDLWATLFTSEPAIVEATRAYLRVVGPFYWLFGLGLASFFASFALKTVIWPVLGGVLRLAIIAGGGLWLALQPTMTLDQLLWVIAVAMACYGGFTALALWLGPWRPQATSISATS